MQLNGDYVKARNERNAVQMWKLIVSQHTVTSNALLNKIKARTVIDNCKQSGRHVEAYCVEYSQKIQEAKLLGADLTNEEELALKFLLHLDPVYRDKVEKLLSDNIVPTTVLKAQAIAIVWSETKALVGPEMGIKSKGEPPLDDTIANVANGNDKKFKKQQNNKNKNNNNHVKNNNNENNNNNKNNYNNNNNKQKKNKNHDKHNSDSNTDQENYCVWCDKPGHSLQACYTWKKKLADRKEAKKNHNNDKNSLDKSKKSKALAALNEDFGDLGFCLQSYVSVRTLSNSFYFDCAATSNIVNDLSLLTNIKKIPAHYIGGIGGSPASYHIGDTDRFGPAYFLASSPCNLVSQKEVLKQNGKVKWDQELSRYEVTLFDMTSHFSVDNNGLYEYHPQLQAEHALIGQDIEEAIDPKTGKHFTPKEIQLAKLARTLHKRMGHCSDDCLKNISRHNSLNEWPITAKDVDNANVLFGKCAACMQGKMTEPAAPTSMSAPPLEIGDTIHCDLFFIKKVPYLISVEDKTGYKMIAELKSKSRIHLEPALEKMVKHLKSYGWNCKQIRSDRENVFRSCEAFLNNMKIELKLSVAGRHERKAERSIRTLKERFRTVLHSLPYKLPHKLYAHLVYSCVSDLNIAPNVLTGALTPRELITNAKVNAKDSLRASFGTIVMFKITNQNHPNAEQSKARNGIIVARDHQTKQGVKVFDLDTNEAVSIVKFDVQPITPAIENLLKLLSINDAKEITEELFLLPDDFGRPTLSLEEIIVEKVVTENKNKIPELTAIEKQNNDEIAPVPVCNVHKGEVINTDSIFENKNIIKENKNIITDNNNIENIKIDLLPASENQVLKDPIIVPETRYPSRSNRTTYQERMFKRENNGFVTFDLSEDIALNLSVKESLQEEPKLAEKAILAEFRQLIVEYRA